MEEKSASAAAEIGLAEAFFSAEDLQRYAAERQRIERAQAAERQAEMKNSEEKQIARLMEPAEIDDERLSNFLGRVRTAAERGEHQILVLRFPSALCRDGGRAINNSLPGWEKTLVGIPQQLLQIWHEHLNPIGFRFTAEILDHPDGMPCDFGLFVKW